MNVFILCTGRCGSSTFVKACEHITNYTASHESNAGRLGPARFAYPNDHIVADNRLSWFLGRLEMKYGDSAFYVHLQRDPLTTAESFAKRIDQGIIHSYAETILMGRGPEKVMDICLDYCHTVNSNIEVFLKNKSRKMRFQMENAQEDFKKFWIEIGARGNLEAALKEWTHHYNSSTSHQTQNSESLDSTV